jgi:hypothetical protein
MICTENTPNLMKVFSGCTDTPPSKIHGAIQCAIPECAADSSSMSGQRFLDTRGDQSMEWTKISHGFKTDVEL